jgi:hypothetical protein
MINIISEQNFDGFINTINFKSYISSSFNLTENYGLSLKKYIILTNFESAFLKNYTFLDLFYNRYYYFCMFIQIYQSQYGLSSDLEQQQFKIIETAANNIENIDWHIVENIENMVAKHY